MNLVSLLIAPAVVMWSVGAQKNTPLRITVALVALAIIVIAVTISKRKPVAMASAADEAAAAADGEGGGDTPGGTAPESSDSTSVKV
jgi:K(+)-stimulated pyrophosphate-energized sodium pump